MFARADISVDACVTIQGTCPVEYLVCGNLVEFHYGGPQEGFHFAFDVTALQKLTALSVEALAQWNASSTKNSSDACASIDGNGEPTT